MARTLVPVLSAFAALLALASLAGCATDSKKTSASPAQPAMTTESTAAGPALTPPVAAKKPKTMTLHGDTRVDNYFWLREKTNPEVIAYLEAENAYTKARMAHTEALQKTLYKEMLGRIKETDLSAPYRKGNYWRYTRTEEGKPYPIYCRKKGSLDAPEEVLLDGNALAEGKSYFRVGVFDISDDDQVLAYSIDNDGSERYTMFFKNLATGAISSETIPDTYYTSAWAADNKTFFYTTQDAASRPYRLWRHTLGADPKTDALIYEEKDEKFELSVGKTRSDKFILCELGSQKTSEVRYLDAASPMAEWKPVAERRQDVEYSVDHHGDVFYIVTNDKAVNFKLMEAPTSSPGVANWKEIIPASDDATIRGVDCFRDFLVVSKREGGNPTLHVFKFKGSALGETHVISFPEAAYSAGLSDNHEYATDTLRFSYTSLITPRSVFDYSMTTKERTLVKETPVLGGYDRAKYTSERVWAYARDGKRVPISLVYRKGLARDGRAPCLLYGYGSYGASSDPNFNSNNVSLLDRGFVYAIAHIRGGQEMGRTWYEDGRLTHKMNTFTDFISCAEFLVREGYTSPDRLAILGGSAGGLLMGAVTNMRPDLFKAVVAAVPFVDVMNTMLDPSLPLTVTEFEQWGDPSNAEAYKYMRSYSPYDNVEKKRYPDMLVLAGLNDPRVSYWEPAKWVAKLRATKTDNNMIILKTNMGAGHGGASNRYQRLEELSLQYAFILDRLGVGDAPPAN